MPPELVYQCASVSSVRDGGKRLATRCMYFDVSKSIILNHNPLPVSLL